MNNLTAKAIGLVFLGAVAGCTTTGSGTATSPQGNVSTSITWQSKFDDTQGSMTAALNNGKTYSGRYFEITRQTTADQVAPLWVGWRDSWHDWEDWGPNAWPVFVTHYTGRVLANMTAPDGSHMRCRFQLADPQGGMGGGGMGRCQLPDGSSIDAVFPAA